MKKITDTEIELICLSEQDIVTASLRMCGIADDSEVYVSGRHYDDTEDEW